jgi:hypothetical protein
LQDAAGGLKDVGRIPSRVFAVTSEGFFLCPNVYQTLLTAARRLVALDFLIPLLFPLSSLPWPNYSDFPTAMQFRFI